MSEVRDTSTDRATGPSPAVVNTDGGQVTLVDLATLRASMESARKLNQDREHEAQSLRTLSEGLWAQRGDLLLSSTAQWSSSPSMADVVAKASSLKKELTATENRIAEFQEEPHGRIGALVAKATEWNQHHKLAAEHIQLSQELRALLIQIARQAPSVTLAKADLIGSQARAADTQAQEVASQAAESAATIASLSAELQRRSEAEREMGFDSLYVAAYVKTYGPQTIQSPLVLKRGEQAAVSVAATLSRQQTRRQWVGGSQGFSFPIGHTGIRYRVGSFHGHPVQQQFLAKLDTGRFVVTNQRIAFIGSVKSTSIPLTKLLHVECYSDGLAVFQEGRENPDLYLMAQPKYPLLLINWFLARNAA